MLLFLLVVVWVVCFLDFSLIHTSTHSILSFCTFYSGAVETSFCECPFCTFFGETLLVLSGVKGKGKKRRITVLIQKKGGRIHMLPKQDIMLKLAEIEESLNQLEQSLHDRISAEEQEGLNTLSNKIQKMDSQLSSLERNTGLKTVIMNNREKSYVLQKLELSFKTS
jgi:hypothetical protein